MDLDTLIANSKSTGDASSTANKKDATTTPSTHSSGAVSLDDLVSKSAKVPDPATLTDSDGKISKNALPNYKASVQNYKVPDDLTKNKGINLFDSGTLLGNNKTSTPAVKQKSAPAPAPAPYKVPADLPNTVLPSWDQAIKATKNPNDLKQTITASIPFTDSAKNIIDKNSNIIFNDALGNDKPIAARTQMNKGTGDRPALPPKNISNIEIGKNADETEVAHELFHTIFLRSNITPQSFNKAWDQAKKSSPDMQALDDRLNDPNNAAAYNNNSGESTKTNAYDLATERFAFMGSLWGNDGLSSLPKELQSFYKPYIAEPTTSTPPINLGLGATSTKTDTSSQAVPDQTTPSTASFAKAVLGIPKSILDQELHPDKEQQAFENFIFPKGTPAILKPLTAVGKAVTRFIMPMVRPLTQDVGESLQVNLGIGYYGKHPEEFLNSDVYKKTAPQVIGDTAQAVFAAVTPSIGADLLTSSFGSGVKEALLKGATEGSGAGLLFGVAQAMSSGSKDPSVIAQTIALNTLGGAFLGAVTSGIIPVGKAGFEGITKDIITEYKMPKSVFIDAEKVKSIFQSGDKISAEEQQMISDLGLTGEQYKHAIKNGISIEVPTEKVITVADKPWWEKVKNSVGLEKSSDSTSIKVEKPKIAPRGYLDAPKDAPVADGINTHEHAQGTAPYEALQSDIHNLLNEGIGPADISEHLQKELGVSNDYAQNIVADTISKRQEQSAALTKSQETTAEAEKPKIETPTTEALTQQLQSNKLSPDIAAKVAKDLEVAVSRQGSPEEKARAITILSNPTNTASRTVYEKETGTTLPKDPREARAVLSERINSTPSRIYAQDTVTSEVTKAAEGSTAEFPKYISEELRTPELAKKVLPYVEKSIRPPEDLEGGRAAQLYDDLKKATDEAQKKFEKDTLNAAAKPEPEQTALPFHVAHDQITNESLIYRDDAEKIIRKYFSAKEVPTVFLDNIRTPRGTAAFGRYANQVIEMVKAPRVDTPYHESVHAFLDLFVPTYERKRYLANALVDAKTRLGNEAVDKGIEDIMALYRGRITKERAIEIYSEEQLADGFYDYVQGRNQQSLLKTFYDKIIAFLKSFKDEVSPSRLYEEIIAKKRYNAARREETMIKAQRDIYQRHTLAKNAKEKTVNSFQEEKSTAGLRPNAEGKLAEPIGSNNGDFSDVVARERFDIPNLKKVSFGGSDRDVYELGDNMVLKVAKTARGLTQNDSSHDYYSEEADLTPKTIEVGENYVVKEKVLPPDAATKKMVKDIDKLLAYSSRDSDYYTKLNELDEKYGAEGLDIYSFADIGNYDILTNDFKAIRNWGTTVEGKPVLIDEGTLNGNLITNHKVGGKNLDDPEFRKLYERSRAAKKQFGDTDEKTMYSEDKIPSQIIRSNTFAALPFENLKEKVKAFEGADEKNTETHAITLGTETMPVTDAKIQRIHGENGGLYTDAYAVVQPENGKQKALFMSQDLGEVQKWLEKNQNKDITVPKTATVTVYNDGKTAHAIVSDPAVMELEKTNIAATTDVKTIKFYDTEGKLLDTHTITPADALKFKDETASEKPKKSSATEPVDANSATPEAIDTPTKRSLFPSYYASINEKPVLVQNDNVSRETVTRETPKNVEKPPKINEEAVKRSDKEQVTQTAVLGEGAKRRVSSAFERSQARLNEAFQNDEVNYTPIKIADQVAKAQHLIETNRSYAEAVALGLEQPPLDITDTAISITMAETARAEGNSALQAQIEQARSLRQTRRGQELAVESGRVDESTPEHFVDQILQRRRALVEAKYKPTIGAAKPFTEILAEKKARAKPNTKILSEDLVMKSNELDSFLADLAC